MCEGVQNVQTFKNVWDPSKYRMKSIQINNTHIWQVWKQVDLKVCQMSLILLEMPFKMFKGSTSINFHQYFQIKGHFNVRYPFWYNLPHKFLKSICINYMLNLWTFWTHFERFRTFRFLGHEWSKLAFTPSFKPTKVGAAYKMFYFGLKQILDNLQTNLQTKMFLMTYKQCIV